MREILADLVAEQQSLDQFLQTLAERDWEVPSAAPGWAIRDVVTHLAHLDGLGARIVSGDEDAVAEVEGIDDLDEFIAAGVARGKGRRYQEVIEGWRAGRAALVDALSRSEARDRVAWVMGSMSARTFATLRLMETWAHGIDIKDAFDIEVDEDMPDPREDTARIRHIAWLAHRMLPFAFEQAGETYPDTGIRIELMGPGYARWVYGPPETDQVIKGLAGEWCRLAVQRITLDETQLKAEGDSAQAALGLVRAY